MLSRFGRNETNRENAAKTTERHTSLQSLQGKRCNLLEKVFIFQFSPKTKKTQRSQKAKKKSSGHYHSGRLPFSVAASTGQKNEKMSFGAKGLLPDLKRIARFPKHREKYTRPGSSACLSSSILLPLYRTGEIILPQVRPVFSGITRKHDRPILPTLSWRASKKIGRFDD